MSVRACPAGVGKPTLGPQSSILGEMLIVGLTADSTSMLDLRTLADWTIRPRLLSTGGVAQVAVLGGDIKEYQIQLDPERMRHYGVTLADVLGATRGMNLNANGGVLYEYGNEYIVRGLLSTTQAQELGRAVVKVDKGPRKRDNKSRILVNSHLSGRRSRCAYRCQGAQAWNSQRTGQTCRAAHRDQAARHQHPGADRQTGKRH